MKIFSERLVNIKYCKIIMLAMFVLCYQALHANKITDFSKYHIHYPSLYTTINLDHPDFKQLPKGSTATIGLKNKIKPHKNLLGMKVKGLDDKILNMAVKAYIRAKKLKILKKDLLVVIDYKLPSYKKRMWVIDMKKRKVLMNVRSAHGVRTGGYVYAKRFSNIPHSRQSSIGVMKTGKRYYGKNGLSLNLHGLEFTNSKVYRRRVVIHKAGYVNSWKAKSRKIGRSWGCPAVNIKYNTKLINLIEDGSLLFSYYPLKDWLNKSKFF